MALKIYFCGSIRGGRDSAEIYPKIVQHLRKYGDIMTEAVAFPDIVERENKKLVEEENHEKYIHDRDVDWLRSANVVIAEVTQPSLGVGYEIGRAVDFKIPILCLYRPCSGKHLSCMIQGAHNGDSFIVEHYEEPDVYKIIDQYMVRFQSPS